VKIFQSAPVLRVAASLLLALGALALFLLGRGSNPPEQTDNTLIDAGKDPALSINSAIDSVLTSFGIPERNIRIRTKMQDEDGFSRTERRVTIGPEIVPVMVNAALNKMAHLYGGRAVASENVRRNTVTIHLELGGMVIHTVILKMDPRASPGPTSPPQTST